MAGVYSSVLAKLFHLQIDIPSELSRRWLLSKVEPAKDCKRVTASPASFVVTSAGPGINTSISTHTFNEDFCISADYKYYMFFLVFETRQKYVCTIELK